MTKEQKYIDLQKAKINVQEPESLGYWCKVLRCTSDDLKVAIYKVGSSVERVREYVEKIVSFRNFASYI